MFKAKDSELSQVSKCGERTLKIEVLEDESSDSVLRTGYAGEGAWVLGGSVPVCELVSCICRRFEGKKRVQIWVRGAMDVTEEEEEEVAERKENGVETESEERCVRH